MSSPAIDYDALAKQHGAVVDYDALAAQHGAISSQGPADQTDKSFGEHVADAAKAFWEKANPATIANGINETLKQNPVDTAKAYGAQNAGILQNAKDAWNRGDQASAIAHGVNYLLNGIPGVGAALDEAQNDAEKGDAGKSLGKTAALATILRVAPKVPEAAGAVADAVPAIADVVKGAPTNPAVLRVTGAAIGAAVGHATGVSGMNVAGGFLGRELGDALAQKLNTSKVRVSPVDVDSPAAKALLDYQDKATRYQAPYQPSAEQPAAAARPASAPAALPSGRVPGRPAIDISTGQDLTGIGNGEFTNGAPLKAPPAPVPQTAAGLSDQILQELKDRATPHKSANTAARELTGKGTMAETKISQTPTAASEVSNLLEKLKSDSGMDASQIKVSDIYQKLLKRNPKAAGIALQLAQEMGNH